MKILRLKALNINSLKGTTEIDFVDLLKENALFAITGPTGSGKSTLLDVISCALYGRTARLKNPNDLMSRHTGEAICEVEFEVKGKVYRSSWTQKRARNKYDGKFQQAKMDLSDVKTDKVIKTGSRDVPKFIEEISGLDFDRFTQSMMLAQGSFDAFLKAKESDRSALLEKITGTKIYADISRMVHERHAGYKQEIEVEEKTLESIELIDEKVLEEKQKNLTENKKQKKTDDKQLKAIRAALTWAEALVKLTNDSEKYTKSFIEISQEKEAKKEDFNKLALANKALVIAPFFTKKEELKKSLEVDTKSSIALETEIKTLRKDITQVKTNCDLVQKEHAQALNDLETQTKKLKDARTIQTQEQEKQKSLVEMQKGIETKTDAENLLVETLTEITQEFTKLQDEFKVQNTYLETNIKDEQLIASLSLTEQNIEKLTQEKTRLQTLSAEKKKYNDKSLMAEQALQAIQDEVNTLTVTSKTHTDNYAEIEKKTDLDIKEEIKLQTEADKIKMLLSQLISYKEITQAKEKEGVEVKLNTEKEKSFTISNKSITEQIRELKSHIGTLQSKKEQELLIKKYEEDRNKLVAGEACFVCGSTEHPFVHHMNKVSLDETTAQITDKEFHLQQKEAELKSSEFNITTLNTKIESSILEIEKLEKQLVPVIEAFKQASFEITEHCEVDLKENLENTQKNLTFIVQRRKEEKCLLKQRDDAASLLQTKEKDLITIKIDLNAITTELKRLDEKNKESTKSLESLSKTLTVQWKDHGLEFDDASYKVQYKELLRRKEVYVKSKEKLKLIEKNLHSQSLEKGRNETKHSSLKAEISAENNKLIKIQANIKTLSQKRITILNVENLEVYETEINNVFKVVQIKEQIAGGKLQELNTKYSEKMKQSEELKQKIVNVNESLQLITEEFIQHLEEQGFKTQEDFQSASLLNAERVKLESSCKSIEVKFNETKTLNVDTAKRLKEHKKVLLTDKSSEVLKEEQLLCQQKVDALQLSIGRDEKELELNSANEIKHKDKIAVLEKKKEAFKVWAKMQELIGSADGSKFAKFAQGITLDQLINLANQHLQALTERYLLVRGQEQKHLLEIEVVDAFQSNVVRPVSTLSGGESFIVSLALALGLSELASQKIAIDSLFLDEGFGTLDEESLETALNALNLLQSSGKMVGVISHVEALKERIPLQIKVIPKGDGTSHIEIA